MDVTAPVSRQVDAYNARVLERFIAAPFEAAAVYEIRDGLICAVWFFRGE